MFHSTPKSSIQSAPFSNTAPPLEKIMLTAMITSTAIGSQTLIFTILPSLQTSLSLEVTSMTNLQSLQEPQVLKPTHIGKNNSQKSS